MIVIRHTHQSKLSARIMNDFEPYGHDSGWVDASLRINDFLLGHIQYEDMKYAEFHQNSIEVGDNNKFKT